MTNLIAHTSNEHSKSQLLEEHLLNVSKRLSSTLEPIGLGTMGELVGLLHDVGKAHLEWQRYIQDPENSKHHPGHSQYGRIVFNEKLFPAIDASDVENDYRYGLAQIIYGHHSSLNDDINFDDRNFSREAQWREDSQHNTNEDLEIITTVLNALGMNISQLHQMFCDGYEEYSLIWNDIYQRNSEHYKEPEKSDNAATFEKNLLNELILAALMDADWLDTQNHEDGIYGIELQTVPNWEPYMTALENFMSSFNANSDMNLKRAEVSDACRSAAYTDPDHGGYKLSVFCGGGKTLASTRYALHHAAKYSKRHIIYVIPFTSIIEQNADVLRRACKAGDNELLEHHCNAGLDYNADVARQLENTDDSNKSANRYDMPLVMTTQVRFFETVFSFDKKSRKLLSDYINSEVIFDEFQAMPVELLDMFYIAAEFLVHIMHCNVVLCSATQAVPAGFGLSHSSFLTGTDWNAKYADKLGRANYIARTTRANSSDPIMTLGEIGDLVFEETALGRSVLVVVNTKRQARDLYENLLVSCMEDIHLYHLSTNMHARHRRAVLDELIKKLETNEKPIVCVSTSLIEAGVDVSFDTVIRYMNGLDSYVQSGGRANRNNDGNMGNIYLVNDPDNEKFVDSKKANATSQALVKFGPVLTSSLNNSLAEYYSTYIADLKNATRGMVDVNGDSKRKLALVDLWGSNEPYVSEDALSVLLGTASNIPRHHSAVRTAQKHLEVIKSHGNDVFVCIDEDACLLLSRWENARTYKEAMLIQRLLQQYSVNVNDKLYSSLSEWLTKSQNYMLGSFIEVLGTDASCCYDMKCGICVPTDNDMIC